MSVLGVLGLVVAAVLMLVSAGTARGAVVVEMMAPPGVVGQPGGGVQQNPCDTEAGQWTVHRCFACAMSMASMCDREGLTPEFQAVCRRTAELFAGACFAKALGLSIPAPTQRPGGGGGARAGVGVWPYPLDATLATNEVLRRLGRGEITPAEAQRDLNAIAAGEVDGK